MHFILRFVLLYVYFKNQENGNTSDFSISYESNVFASRQEFIIGIYSMAHINSAILQKFDDSYLAISN